MVVDLQKYPGGVEDLLELESVVQLLPNARLNGTTMEDIDNHSTDLFTALPDSKVQTNKHHRIDPRQSCMIR